MNLINYEFFLAGTVQDEAQFTVKQSSFDSACPDVIKASPVLEFQASNAVNASEPLDSASITETNVTLTFKHIQDEDVCLFSQENLEDSRKLNEWTVHYPTQTVDETVQFGLKNALKENSSKMFLGKMNDGFDLKHIQQLDSNSVKTKLPSYKYIKPGLNYRVVCENKQCNAKQVVINQGYGSFKPCDDIEKQKLKCPKCSHHLDANKSIRLIILFRAKGSIQFNDDQDQTKQSDFNLDNNSTLKVYDGETSLDKYQNLVIDANENYLQQEGVDEVKVRKRKIEINIIIYNV